MSAASDLADGLAFAQTVNREKEAQAILSAVHLSLSWGVFAAGDGFLTAGTNQTHFLVPNGGWLKMANFFVGGDGWAEGAPVATLYALRGEDEVALATATLTPEDPQATQFELVQIQAGDQLHVEVVWGDVGEAEVIATVTAALGLFR